MTSALHYLLQDDPSYAVNWSAVLRAIEEDPAEASVPDATGRVPLSLALSKMDPPPPAHVVKALLEADPSAPSRGDMNGRTPIFYACSNSALGSETLAVLGLDSNAVTQSEHDPNDSFGQGARAALESPRTVQSTPDCSTTSDDGQEAETHQSPPESLATTQPLSAAQPRLPPESQLATQPQANTDLLRQIEAIPEHVETSTTLAEYLLAEAGRPLNEADERADDRVELYAAENEPESRPGMGDVAQYSSHISNELSADLNDGSVRGTTDDPDMTEEIRKRHRAVSYVKVIAIVVLVVSAFVVTFLAYYLKKGEEDQKFVLQYNVFSLRVAEAVSHNMDMKVWTAYSTLAMFSHYKSWPNVTVPNFEAKVKAMLLMAHAQSIGFSPLVTNETRSEWETYAADNAGNVFGMDGPFSRASAVAWDGTVHSLSHTIMDEDASDLAKETSDVFGTGNGGGGLRGRRRQAEDELGIDMTHSGGTEGMSHDDMSQSHSRIIADGMYKINGTTFVDEDDLVGPFLPLWQISPLEPNRAGIMYNQYSEPIRRRAINEMLSHKHPTMTEIMYNDIDWHSDDEHHNGPNSILFYPMLGSLGQSSIVGTMSIFFSWASIFMTILPSDIKGMICVVETNTGQSFTFELNGAKANFLGKGDLHDPMYDHMEFVHSYDFHDIDYFYSKGNETDHSNHRQLIPTAGRNLDETADDWQEQQDGDGDLRYTIKVYPSDTFRALYITKTPRMYAVVVALIFFFTSATFLIYDCLVERRQTAVMHSAIQSNKIVHSFFPASVRDRILNADEEFLEVDDQGGGNKSASRLQRLLPEKINRASRRMSLKGDDSTTFTKYTLPIADHFTDTTILFADIAGFTAWSSEREPTQVFQLLEALFREFDAEARRQKVFKVETIGDCYVAVTGLPDPRPDHAVAMARFAQRCLTNFSFLTNELELSLGPGTAELGMRIGLHSGPVTAGVLRGDKARFQLFGDTMNTASRMESTGQKNMVQISQQTADLLIAAGKGSSISPREDLVHAKGKGTMQTYWLKPMVSRRHSGVCGSAGSTPWHFEEQVQGSAQSTSEQRPQMDKQRPKMDKHESFFAIDTRSLFKKQSSGSNYDTNSWRETGFKDAETSTLQPSKIVQRLIKWNAAVLEKLVVKLMDDRKFQRRRKGQLATIDEFVPTSSALFSDEVAEAVKFQTFDRETVMASAKPRRRYSTSLVKEAQQELHRYVARIASMYRNVHFHNFEHASHVTMSAHKLMNKVCSRDFDSGGSNAAETRFAGCSKGVDLFFSTFGISSDPLAQLAVVFAALVHDVDHMGVPNVILVEEVPELGEKYRNKSVAENNSIDIAWSVLMEPGFENLRRCMFATDSDKDRFRQLLINVVIATDIADRDRMKKEEVRWQKAFSNISSWKDEWQGKTDNELASVDMSLKATVVLEQIMLASDVSHTMQHWLTFVKWNERLYRELWSAYVSGRSKTDPTVGWYEGQIGFFDGYIIPLASKLKECGVFGSAGAEYLGHALSNRAEWKEKGQEISERFEETIRNNPDTDDEPNYWLSH